MNRKNPFIGRCIGFPGSECHKHNKFAKNSRKTWLCESCKEMKLKKWQGEHV